MKILNDVYDGNLEGHYTRISDSGNSVIDYILASYRHFQEIYRKAALNVIERIEADHQPVLLCMDTHFQRRNCCKYLKVKMNSLLNIVGKKAWLNILQAL